jgi:ribosomal protein S6
VFASSTALAIFASKISAFEDAKRELRISEAILRQLTLNDISPATILGKASRDTLQKKLVFDIAGRP